MTDREGETLSPHERRVLAALCRPGDRSGVFRLPSSTREIARRLGVSEATVRTSLAQIAERLGVTDPSHRRVRLANEAVRRGLVPPPRR